MITETSRNNPAWKRLLPAAFVALSLLALFASTGNASRPRPSSTARASVIGGETAAPGTFPWMAVVIDVKGEEGFVCSGTVVAPNLILTAGHCAADLATGLTNEAAGYGVITGNVNALASNRQLSRVSRVLVYPRYTVTGTMGGWGDAALLVLSTSTTAPAIPLATSANAERLRAGTHALIAGWGETEYGQKKLTGQLMWAKSIVRGGHQCKGDSQFRFEAQICVTHPPGVVSGTCFGDSGGPLLAAGPGGQGLVEIGIENSGVGHCTTRYPHIYTRADLISPWVDRWIAALDPPPSTRPRSKPSVLVLDNQMAEIDTRQALREGLGIPFKRRFGYHISCRSIDSFKQRCVTYWFFRAKLFYGSVFVHLQGGNATSWGARYTTEWVTDHCYFHTDREHCRFHRRSGSRTVEP